MKPIRLPEPPRSPKSMGGVPDIFEGGIYGVVRRAVIIGNGFPSSENQSMGLVRALGFSDKQTLYRVTRPTGGINEWLHWLPVSIHKKLYLIISQILGCSNFFISRSERRVAHLPAENGAGVGLSSVLEADVKNIVKMAKETFEKDGPLLVVASGRDTISIASSIKRLASENVFVVQVQHPRSHLERFDMVITPQHDYYSLTPQAQDQVPRFLRKWTTPCEPPADLCYSDSAKRVPYPCPAGATRIRVRNPHRVRRLSRGHGGLQRRQTTETGRTPTAVTER